MNNFSNLVLLHKSGNKIHIKQSNEGKFTDYCGGKVTDKCILKAKKSGNKKLIKRAVFAQNARGWKHLLGGTINEWLEFGKQSVDGILSGINEGKLLLNKNDLLKSVEDAKSAYLSSLGTNLREILEKANAGDYNASSLNDNKIDPRTMQWFDNIKDKLIGDLPSTLERIVGGLGAFSKKAMEVGLLMVSLKELALEQNALNTLAVNLGNLQGLNEDGSIKPGFKKMPNGVITFVGDAFNNPPA